MKHLQLLVTEVGRRDGRFLYQIMEGGRELAHRRSNRVYMAALVMSNEDFTQFSVPYFFGRLDLIGKGDSRHVLAHAYAVAVTTYSSMMDDAGSRIMMDAVDHTPFVVSEQEFREAIQLKASVQADHPESHVAVHDLDGHAHIVYGGDIPSPRVMEEVAAYVTDPNCRPGLWADGLDRRDQVHFLDQIELLGGMDKIRARRDQAKKPAGPEGRNCEADDRSETYSIWVNSYRHTISPETHRDLYRAFEAGVNIASFVDVDGLEAAVDVKRMFEATKLKVGGQFTVNVMSPAGLVASIRELVYRGTESEHDGEVILHVFTDRDGQKVYFDDGFAGTTYFFQAEEAQATNEQKLQALEDLAELGNIAQRLALHLVKIGTDWETAEPMFTAILEQRLKFIAKDKDSEHAIPAGHES